MPAPERSLHLQQTLAVTEMANDCSEYEPDELNIGTSQDGKTQRLNPDDAGASA